MKGAAATASISAFTPFARLGLSIVHRIVEKLGVESASGQGSTSWFTLPLKS